MRHLVAGAIHLGTWSLVLLGPAGESDSLALTMVVVGSVSAGVVAQDWRILVLALAIVPLAALAPCDPVVKRCEVDFTVLGVFLFMPIGLGLLALGVAFRKMVGGARSPTPR